ncbi:hypothetical protein [Paenibacillus kobensis]|uniref:hypothetical protein n=1 Tax=Paenibacillus kobensis TaxID=59841 RepID=UPI000FD6F399|nr:hypothetical protein [Paenibacillus kobensis]
MLAITSMSCIGPWGETIEAFVDYCNRAEHGGCGSESDARQASIPPVPGFIESTFSPLVYRTIQHHFENERIRDQNKLAIILGSTFGDTATADLASRNLLSGKIRNPLLFYQSVPNSILGYASNRFQLTEMFTCITYSGGAAAALLEMAEIYLSMADVEQVLIIGVEIQSDRADEMFAHLAKGDEPVVSRDTVVSLLLEECDLSGKDRGENGPVIEVQEIARKASEERLADTAGLVSSPIRFIGNEGLLNLVLAVEQLSRLDESISNERTVTDVTFGGDHYAITIVRRPHLV